jgi:hypothetical protein
MGHRGSLKTRYRLAATLALLVAALAGFFTFTAGGASANYPIVQAGAECADAGGWNVRFDVESWEDSIRKGGGNPHIDVWYKVRGDAEPQWTKLDWKPTWAFTELNGFKFSDFVHVAHEDGERSVRIRVKAAAPWSAGAPAGEAVESEWVKLRKNCDKGTTTTTANSTTTTTWATTTTTAGGSTSTTRPGGSTSTTVAVSPTSVVRPSTTGAVATTVVAVSPESVVTAPVSTGRLPVTGANTIGLVVFAGALLTGGFLLLRAGRTRV